MKFLSQYRASQNIEFQAGIRAIQPVMMDKDVLAGEKRRVLCAMVDNLSQEVFDKPYIADAIITMINVKENICKQYDSVDSQVNGILGWLPRMKQYRSKLEKYVKEYRSKYGMEL